VQDLLSLDEFHEKFGLEAHNLQYFKIIAAKFAEKNALRTSISSEYLFSTLALLHLSEDSTLPLTKKRCKNLTGALCWNPPKKKKKKKWKENVPNSFLDSRSNFTKIHQIA